MKRILIVLGILLEIGAGSYAVTPAIWLSSNTATADTNQVLCGQYVVNNTTTTLHGVVHAIIVSSGTSGGVTLYNSSYTTTSQSIGPVNTATVSAPFDYDVIFGNGLMYNKTGTAQVQMLYACY